MTIVTADEDSGVEMYHSRADNGMFLNIFLITISPSVPLNELKPKLVQYINEFL